MATVQISVTISKLGPSIPAINLPPIITCRDDAPCAKCAKEGGGCYALRGHFIYSSVKKRLAENLEAYKENPKLYFEMIANQTRLYNFVRWHSSGDIVDTAYLEGMCRVARKNKFTRYLAFTKKFELVNEFIASGKRIPSNLKIVFSTWKEFVPENPYSLPMASVYFPRDKKANAYVPNNAYTCPGKCAECTMCWNLKKGEGVVFRKH